MQEDGLGRRLLQLVQRQGRKRGLQERLRLARAVYRARVALAQAWCGPSCCTAIRTDAGAVWEHYIQIGGTKKLAASHRLGQATRVLALLAFIVAFRRMGWKKIKQEGILFLLMRYQDLNQLRFALRG